jgi:uncharacterized protein (DUF1684 family)
MSDVGEILSLADWRRTIAALYANVRALARVDPIAAWRLWADERERLYRTHPQSPVPPAERGAFEARHFPYDPALRFEVRVDADPPAADGLAAPEGLAAPLSAPEGGGAVGLPMSTGSPIAFTRLGHVAVPFPAGPRRLALYWMAGYAGGLFLPFRDGTNGSETYAAGRYAIDGAKSADLGPGAADGTIVLDFNFAYQPSCAFDPRWACPLAPPENRLDLPVRAGERLS